MTVDLAAQAAQAEINIWKDRWDALDMHLEALKVHINSLDITEHREALLALVEALQTFGKNHFDFFYNGFSPSSLALAGTTPLAASKNFPPNYVFRQIIHRVSEDYEVIQQCVEDRLRNPDNSSIQETLTTADKLVYTALKPIIDSGVLPENTVVICYFHKKPSIRVIPYASVALIGIPLTSLITKLDYMALYHEVGHYVYRHAQITGTVSGGTVGRVRIAQRMAKIVGSDAWLQNWKEELFADIFGSLTGGIGMALAFEYMEDEASNAEFGTDDGTHPISSIRPEIYFRVLTAQTSTPPTALINKLRNRWDKIIKGRSDDDTIAPFLIMKGENNQQNVLARDTVLNKIGAVIQQVIAIPELQISPTLPTTVGPDLDPTSIEQVVTPRLIQGAAAAQNGRLVQVPEKIDWNDWVVQFGLETEAGSIPEKKWLDVLDAGGWRTEGPHPRPDDDPG